jgi:hypothetical protein
MRLPRRVHSSLHGVFAFLAFASFALPILAQTSATSPDPLPAKWNEAVTTLAEKIAAGAAPARRISLEVRNLSSLDSNQVNEIHRALQSELGQRHLRFASVTASDAQVRMTISEGASGRILVADIRRGKERQVALVSAPIEPVAEKPREPDTLTLTTKLVWTQPQRFLDFVLFEALPEPESRLLIVEPRRLVYYHSASYQWEALRTIPIPPPDRMDREITALVDVAKEKVLLTRAECSGNLVVPDEVHCTSSGAVNGWETTSSVPGHVGSLTATLSQTCNGGLVMLVSGAGDWTEPDTLQAFQQKQMKAPPIPTGNVINFDGPILGLAPNGPGTVARAVVHNLRTGDYEAYLVTANCGH